MNKFFLSVFIVLLISGCSFRKEYHIDFQQSENNAEIYIDPVITGVWERATLVINIDSVQGNIENILSTCSCLEIEKTKTDDQLRIFFNYRADVPGINQSGIILDTLSEQYYIILLYDGQE